MAVTGLPLKSAGIVIAPLRLGPEVVALPELEVPSPIDALDPFNVYLHVTLPTVNWYTDMFI
jgi:hypothetical protein